MIEKISMPDYIRLKKALEATGLALQASEIHGVISGLICAGPGQVHVDWMEALFADWSDADLLIQEVRQMIGQLYYATRDQITNDELKFMPFLPDDSEPIADRAKALSEWCEGFLYGLGMAGISEQQFSGDAKEALEDLTHFTRLDYSELESGDATEMAYVELQEFLKVVTLLMWQELADVRSDNDAT
ncbi:MAG: UPF0149 family protein [Candidatus Thiodiazotropha sp.]|jgi:uncharacterized protein